MNILEINHIDCGYKKKQVLFDVSFKIKKGECMLLVGSNGSGKSTLFKSIYRQLNLWSDSCQIILDEEDITKFRSCQLLDKGLMYIPQKDELFEDCTVQENLEFSILHLKDKKIAKIRLNEALDALPLLIEKLDQQVSCLSGGERKLVTLAMVLVNKPKVLLYDEPLASLSKDNIEMMINHLSYMKDKGVTLLLIEHKIKELLYMTDNVIGLKLGRKSNKLNTIEDIKAFMI